MGLQEELINTLEEPCRSASEVRRFKDVLKITFFLLKLTI